MLAPFVSLVEAIKDAGEESSDPNNRDGFVPFAFVFANIFAVVVFFLYLCMRLVSTVFSRKREYLADAGAVQFTRNPLALAQALHKISKEHHFMGGAAGAFAPMFVVDSSESHLSEGESWVSNLFASHPPIAKRLDILLKMAHAGPEDLDAPAPLEGSDLDAATSRGASARGEGLFLLRLADGWSAPLALDQLLVHGAFRSDAWVTPQGAFSPIQALKDPIIAAAMGLNAERSLSGNGEEAVAGEVASSSESTPTQPIEISSSPEAAPPAGATHSFGKCPLCRESLREEFYEGTSVGRCARCKGVFAEENKAKRILSRREKRFSEEFRQKTRQWVRDNEFRKEEDLGRGSEGGRKDRPCPRCDIPMNRRFFSYQYMIEVDRCFSCQSIWFDHEELEMLQVLVEEKGRG